MKLRWGSELSVGKDGVGGLMKIGCADGRELNGTGRNFYNCDFPIQLINCVV